MNDKTGLIDRIAALEARLAAAEGRIAALEARLQSQGWPAPVTIPLAPQMPVSPYKWPWHEVTCSTDTMGRVIS